MPQPGLASHAAHDAVASSLDAKARTDDGGRPQLPPLTLGERLLVVAVMFGAWAGMIALSLLRR